MLRAAFDHIPTGDIDEDLMNSTLLMEVGEKWFGYTLFQKKGQRLWGLRQYQLDEIPDTTPADYLEEIVLQDEILQRPVKESVIIYNYPDSTLVPDACFDRDVNRSIVELMQGDSNKGLILSEKIYEWNIYNVYRVPRSVHTLLQKKFAAGRYWHYYSLLLSTLKDSVNGAGLINAVFYSNQFIVAVFQQERLLLMRSFDYATSEDVLYHLLSACHHLGLDPSTVALRLSGLIDEQSALYSELFKYFLDIHWDSVHMSFSLEVPENELPLHYFSPLLNMALCV